MLTIEPTGAVLGATVTGVDLAQPLSERDFARILLAIGRYGVLRFPDQHLDLGALRRFAERFGEIQGSAIRDLDRTQGYPEIGILSNVKENGKYIGSPYAGKDWHTDMSYLAVPGFVNVLYGIRIPRRDGKPLGGTECSNMHMAYDELPADIKTRLADMTTTHDFAKFWPPQTPLNAELRNRLPPVAHPLFLTHPISGKKVLYCNPAYTVRINELSERDSEEMLGYFLAYQLEMRFRYTNVWSENDVLLLDHLGMVHRAIADYGPDEPRLIRRCQVMGSKVFDPAFLRSAREAEAAGGAL